MRAVVVERQGPPEVLQVAAVAEPTPRSGQVRLRVHGAAVNPADLLLRSGAIRVPEAALPFIVGMDVAGIVDLVGPGTETSLRVGDPVMAMTIPIVQGGAYADHVTVPVSWVVAAPEGLSLHEAATIPMNGLTALQGIEVLGLEAGDTVAVTGSAGAFGGYFLQLAGAAGIRTIADASPADETLIRTLGADAVVGRGPAFADEVRKLVPDGVAAVLDAALIGAAVLPAIAEGGTYSGLRGNKGPGTSPLPPPPREIRYCSFDVASCAGDQAKLQQLQRMAAQGVLTPRIAEVVRPEEASRAHEALERGGVRGRFVLDFSE
jgi:NADPH:quinone reductase